MGLFELNTMICRCPYHRREAAGVFHADFRPSTVIGV